MADKYHLEKFRQGPGEWNKWRRENSQISIDLSNIAFPNFDFQGYQLGGVNLSHSNLQGGVLETTDLTNADLSFSDLSQCRFSSNSYKGAKFEGVDLSGAKFKYMDLAEINLSNSKLSGAAFYRCSNFTPNFMNVNLIGVTFSRCHFSRSDGLLKGFNFSGATFWQCYFSATDLSGADFSDAKLEMCNFYGANLSKTSFRRASITGSELNNSILIETDFEQTSLSSCWVYGASVWDIKGEPRFQSVIITPFSRGVITVGSIQLAQFIYMLLENKNISNIIDSLTAKTVLILGRFTEERKQVLDAIWEKLRMLNYVPVLFDFDKPKSKDVTGTVETVARISQFIIADLTDPSSIPHELATIVPHLRTTPIVSIQMQGSTEYSMFQDFVKSYRWVFKTFTYNDSEHLISQLPEVIDPAIKMAAEFRSHI